MTEEEYTYVRDLAAVRAAGSALGVILSAEVSEEFLLVRRNLLDMEEKLARRVERLMDDE